MTSQDENTEIVRRVQFDAYTGEEDPAVVDELVSDDFVLHQIPPVDDIDVRGPDGLREHIERTREGSGGVDITIERIVAEGDLVASHFTGSGTHDGPIPGIDLEPTGEEFEIVGMEFDRVEDGKLAETWLLVDALGILQQLGALPDEEPPTER